MRLAFYDRRRRCNQQVLTLTERRQSASLLTYNRMKIRCVIGAAHQRAGSDMLEAFLARDFTQEFELFGRDIFHHGQVLRSRPEILPHRKNLRAYFAQIIHRLKQLRFSFAEAKHDAALRHYFWRKFFGALQNP